MKSCSEEVRLPTRAPRRFLKAEWRKLIMAQYVVDPASLMPWVPRGLELDFYCRRDERRCYVSLVGFLFDRVRVKGLGFPFHTRFEEVNLRFYVRRRSPDGISRRGVVFLREYVPRMAISLMAKWLYEEPYQTLPMAHQIRLDQDALRVSYEWEHKGKRQRLAVLADPSPSAIKAGSEEEFITEHYWGYTKRRRGATSEYPVEHPRWCVYPVRKFEVKAEFGAMYGAAFGGLSSQQPASVILAEGSEVAVFEGRRLAL
jgi:uncharacterized protein YqjF (DUF2071 family)